MSSLKQGHARHPLLGLIVAIAAVGIATLLTFPLVGVTVHSLSLLFTAAVMFSAWYGGLIPGLVASLLSVLSFDWFFDFTPHALDLSIAGIERALVFTAVAAFITALNIQQRNLSWKLGAAVDELNAAMEEIKTLRGILPICMYCKHIRNDAGAWEQIEKYISQHSDVQFTHGICPKCLRDHYPEYVVKLEP